ncbi:LexA family transcriptional regulator [Pseudomonas sp.]|uniref:LexA family protein n=1 Tax=Pseudomonas sp. TaxID=306 RepID=UPI00289DDDB9|nr:LexA family transcriptional regulator [Pseudomonas sp.]
MKTASRKRVLTPEEQAECARLKAIYQAKKKELGLTQEHLAEVLGGINQSAVSHYLNGVNALNKDVAATFAQVLHVSVSDFSPRLAGEIEKLTEQSGKHPSHMANVMGVSLGHSMQQYPVISWVQAGEWSEVVDIQISGNADLEWSSTPAGPHGFWLRVRGDSMTSPAGLSIQEGMLILVNPSITATSGRLVIAKLTDSGEVTFKRYIEDAGRKYLKPLNPDYKMIEVDGNCQIVGVVVEAKWAGL